MQLGYEKKCILLCVFLFCSCSESMEAAETLDRHDESSSLTIINADDKNKNTIKVSDLEYYSNDSVSACKRYISIVSSYASSSNFCLRSFEGHEDLMEIEWIELSSDEAISAINYLTENQKMSHIKDKDKVQEIIGKTKEKTISDFETGILKYFSSEIDINRDGKKEKIIKRNNDPERVSGCLSSRGGSPYTYYVDDRPDGELVKMEFDLQLDYGWLIRIDDQIIIDKWHKDPGADGVGIISLTELLPNPSPKHVKQLFINRNICQFKVKFN